MEHEEVKSAFRGVSKIGTQHRKRKEIDFLAIVTIVIPQLEGNAVLTQRHKESSTIRHKP
tara:strand:- start:320 stop:499 length:180 start_codon:yes stop_codon:yes gene_type:complete